MNEPDLGAPTTLLLIRHGHTDITGNALAGGDKTGPGLNAAGHRAATELAAALNDSGAVQPAVLIQSPARRASQTAQVIGAALGLEPRSVEAWNEGRAGAWHGLSVAQIIERWPLEYRAWLQSSAVAPPNGESADEVAARVMKAVGRLVEEHRRRVVAVVSHAGPIRAVLGSALGAGLVAARRFRIDPCSVSVLRIWSDGGCEVEGVNAALPWANHE